MTIHILDCRAFGREVLCGTHVIGSLHDYFQDPDKFETRKPDEPTEEEEALAPTTKKKKGCLNILISFSAYQAKTCQALFLAEEKSFSYVKK